MIYTYLHSVTSVCLFYWNSSAPKAIRLSLCFSWMFLQQIECLRRENNRPIKYSSKRAERLTAGIFALRWWNGLEVKVLAVFILHNKTCVYTREMDRAGGWWAEDESAQPTYVHSHTPSSSQHPALQASVWEREENEREERRIYNSLSLAIHSSRVLLYACNFQASLPLANTLQTLVCTLWERPFLTGSSLSTRVK
jgi:hypothetical protein